MPAIRAFVLSRLRAFTSASRVWSHRLCAVFGLLACLLLSVAPLEAVTEIWVSSGAPSTLLSTDLNGLGNNSYTPASATFDPAGYVKCRLELFAVFAANPTANTAVALWFLKSIDGSTFEPAPTASIDTNRPADVTFLVVTGQTTTRRVVVADCPLGPFKISLKNDSTGQAMNSTGNTVRINTVTLQGQ